MCRTTHHHQPQLYLITTETLQTLQTQRGKELDTTLTHERQYKHTYDDDAYLFTIK